MTILRVTHRLSRVKDASARATSTLVATTKWKPKGSNCKFSTVPVSEHDQDAKNVHFPHLFQPLDLGPAIGKLPNRIIMGSMHTGLEGHSIPKPLVSLLNPDHDHHDLSDLATYFEQRAKGGASLMVTGGISPNYTGGVGPFAAKLSTQHEVDIHREVTDRVHAVQVPSYTAEGETTESSRICLQILHTGRYAHHPFAVAPSPTKAPISMFKARELSIGQIHSTIKDFVNCAVLAKQAGYDGVEIMGSEGYLINQFLVKKTNFRKDEYGGDFLNRIKFAVDIVKETRDAVGPDFIIIFRLSMLDLVEKGSSWDEVKILAQAIEDAGATIINTGIGWHEARIPTIATSVPRGAYSFVSKKLRGEGLLSIPICATNRINAPHVAEQIIHDESADLVSMARPFLADPDIVAKSREGRVDEINTCIGCNQACLDHIFVGKTSSCLVNPSACHETEVKIEENSITPEQKLNIGVIGAGPAGMAFAKTAATVGHNVTLYDKSDTIGGQFNMAKRVPGKEEFHETIRYFDWQLKKLESEGKLKLRLQTEITNSEMEKDSSTDKWIVATGVNPRTPSIPGIDHPNVLSYIDVLRNNAKVGKKVAVIGAGGIGFDVSEFLLHHDEDSTHDLSADEVDKKHFFADWGVDTDINKPGGLLPKKKKGDASASIPPSKREIILMQRKKGKLGKGLGKTTGWIHRATLTKSKAVEMIDSVSYDKVDEDGNLHITITKKGDKKEKRVLEVDNIILCAGQTSKKDLKDDAASELSNKTYTIGGAYEALELDAKRAIDMGTRLALNLTDPSVMPGNHVKQPGVGAEERMYEFLHKYMR